MPLLPDPKHEAYCHQIVGGCSKTEAAKRAGYSKNSNNAGSRIGKLPQVVERIKELTLIARQSPNEPGVQGQAKYYQSEPFVVAEVVSVHRKAFARDQLTVCISALRTLAQMGGLLNDGSGNPRNINTTNNIAMLNGSQLNVTLKEALANMPLESRAKLLEGAPDLAELMAEPKPTKTVDIPADDAPPWD